MQAIVYKNIVRLAKLYGLTCKVVYQLSHTYMVAASLVLGNGVEIEKRKDGRFSLLLGEGEGWGYQYLVVLLW